MCKVHVIPCDRDLLDLELIINFQIFIHSSPGAPLQRARFYSQLISAASAPTTICLVCCDTKSIFNLHLLIIIFDLHIFIFSLSSVSCLVVRV